jgi:hypothetical protein
LTPPATSITFEEASASEESKQQQPKTQSGAKLTQQSGPVRIALPDTLSATRALGQVSQAPTLNRKALRLPCIELI